MMSEIAVLEQMSTNIVASPIASPLSAEVVVASVGHIPRRSTKVGVLRRDPVANDIEWFHRRDYS